MNVFLPFVAIFILLSADPWCIIHRMVAGLSAFIAKANNVKKQQLKTTTRRHPWFSNYEENKMHFITLFWSKVRDVHVQKDLCSLYSQNQSMFDWLLRDLSFIWCLRVYMRCAQVIINHFFMHPHWIVKSKVVVYVIFAVVVVVVRAKFFALGQWGSTLIVKKPCAHGCCSLY